MELRHLRYFVTVAEERNVSRAASRLHVSQPAISKQLKDLEGELGVPLFRRIPAGIELTNAGETFLVHARDILRRATLATGAMQAFRENQAQHLAIGYIPTVMPAFLAATLRDFTAGHPQVAVELRELSPGQQVSELAAGNLDLAFVGNACPDLHDKFEVRAIRRIPLEIALPASHPLARKRSLDLAELAEETFIGFDEKKFPGRNTLICDLCREAGFTPPLEPRAGSLASALALVGAARGLAIMPEDVVSLPHPQVVFIPLKRPTAFVESSVVWSRERSDGLVAEFLGLLTKSD